MTVPVDTSVWVDHFRCRNSELAKLPAADSVAMHPVVLLELACGTPPARAQTLRDLGCLRPVNRPSLAGVGEFIESERLPDLGCGMVDSVLLASMLIAPGARLWTRGRRFARLAGRFAAAHRFP